MATSFGLKQFKRRMEAVAVLVNRNADQVVRQAALAVDRVAVTSTPVDTGRARANWVVSIGFPILSNRASELGFAATGPALAQGAQVIAAWRGGLPPIYVSNGVPYIEQLDEGRSNQAPFGMSQQALLAGATIARGGQLLKGV